VDEVVEEGVLAAAAHPLGHQVEVVVLDHHGGPTAERLHLLGHRVGELVVHGHVPVLEGVALVPGDVGLVAQVPEVVLDEPEERVRDDGVELVLLVRVELQHADPKPRTLAFDIEGAALVLPSHLHVLVAECGAHPHRAFEVARQPRQRRDQTAVAPLRLAFPVDGLVLDRAAVGDDDQGVPDDLLGDVVADVVADVLGDVLAAALAH
jgi:hypothetical protein